MPSGARMPRTIAVLVCTAARGVRADRSGLAAGCTLSVSPSPVAPDNETVGSLHHAADRVAELLEHVLLLRVEHDELGPERVVVAEADESGGREDRCDPDEDDFRARHPQRVVPLLVRVL